MAYQRSWPSALRAIEGLEPIALAAACPLCHTAAPAGKAGDWTCATCGQNWSAEGLDTAAAYALYAAAHPALARTFVDGIPKRTN